MDILWDYNELYGFIWGTNRKNQHHLKANDPVRYRPRSEQDGPISVNLLGGFLFFKWGYTIKTLGYEEVVGICWNDLSGM